jgi:PAS domain S-box-containing protein
MRARIDAHDWSSSTLGPQDNWPQPLRTTVALMLDSRYPMFLAWGASLISLFNDACLPLLGEKLAAAPGQPLRECSSGLWEAVAPYAESALGGQSTWMENLLVATERNGFPEQAFVTFSCSPVRDEAGMVAGLLCVMMETTVQTRAERRQAFLLETADQLRELSWPREIMRKASELLGRHLGVARAGYGEVDRHAKAVRVERDWNSDTSESLVGTALPLESFGPAAIGELKAGRTLRLDDIAADPRSAPYAAGYASIGMGALLVVPLVKRERLTAVLYLHDPKPRAWQDEDELIARDLAERTWEAVGRARAEEALRTSEARYRTLTETISAIVWRCNSRGMVVADMPSWSDFTGQSREQYQGAGWLDAVHPDDAAIIRNAWAACTQAGTPYNVSYRLRRHDGQYRDVVSLGVPVRNREGETREWIGNCNDVTDAKRDAEMLRLAQERFEAALIAGEVSTWIWNIPDNRVASDRNLNRLFGIGEHSTSDLPIERYLEMIHPEDQEQVNAAIRNAIDKGDELFQCEYRIVQAPGIVRNVLARGRLERGPGGAAVRIPGVVLDVTAQTQAREALRESEARLWQLANTIPQLAWMANPDGHIHWYNDRWYEYTGTTLAQMEGWGWQSVHDPALREGIVENWKTSIATGQPFEMTFPLRAANGEFRNFLTKAAPLHDRSGNIVQWFGTNTDVSPLEAAEKAVRDSERRLREGLVAARMAVWNWNLLSGEVKFAANSDVAFGQSWDSETLGWQSVHPEDRPALRSAIDQAIAERGQYDIAVRMLRPDCSEIIWVDIRGTVETDAEGKACAIRGIFLDITERKRAEEALRDAGRRKDEFLAMLAHELRNPLAPISTAAQILKLGQPDAARVRQTSDVISRQVQHMTKLVDDLLDVSRVTRGLITLNMQPLELGGIIADAVEQVRPLIEARGHSLTVQMPEESAHLQGDKTRLVQVIANLLNNAARYTPDGGEIALEAVISGDRLELAVTDSGIGILPDLLPHVFDLFAQAERSPDRSQGGLGLGLALVKSLVDLHGGSVTAESRGAGAGSRFTVRLPRRHIAADGPIAPDVAALATAIPGLHLMIVDDNVDAARSLAILLEAEGHHVTVEHDACSALQRAQSGPPQVWILDIGLPDMDGYELAAKLRALPSSAEAILIALTGYGGEGDIARSAAAGFDHHLVKPASIAMLSSLLRAVKVSPSGVARCREPG